MKIPVAVIIDNNSLAKWQKESLDFINKYIEIKLILNCQNTNNKKFFFKHFIYYIINFFSLKNSQTSKLRYKNNKAKLVNFDSLYEGSWQRMPQDVVNALLENDIKLVIKFGMSLLIIDEFLERFDIISFHHGDPEKYRGRPAGFYEMYQDADKVGIVVQKLCNKLDSGTILSKGYSKIFSHSYKKTALNFFLNSKYILKHAILNYASSKVIPQKKLGKNFTLPSNFTGILFFLKIIINKIKRIIYALFFEKKWNIAKLSNVSFEVDHDQNLSIVGAQIPKIASKYSFYADPFFSSDGLLIRAEALNKLTGLGEIIELNSANLKFKDSILHGGHFSYPFSFYYDDQEYLLPEISSQSSQIILSNPIDIKTKTSLRGIEDLKIVDATLVQKDNIFFLFAGLSKSSIDCLYLFYSDSLYGTYKEHPFNPIVIDPSCARMAGRIQMIKGQLYRFGQNNSYKYGEKISVMKIRQLNKNFYSEERVSSIKVNSVFGPHTIDIKNNDILFDFYSEDFNILAGYRRIIGYMNKSS